MDKETATLKNIERTDEIQDIIDRIPETFGKIIAYILLGIFILLAVFSITVQYPDVIIGQVNINSPRGPIKLIANTSGKLHLFQLSPQRNIKMGDYLGWIENPSSIKDIKELNKILHDFSTTTGNYSQKLKKFYRKFHLGEINSPYFNFIDALQQLANYENHNLFLKQRAILEKILNYQQDLLSAANQRMLLYNDNLKLVKKSFDKDSILYDKKVLSNADLDRSGISFLNARDGYQSIFRELILIQQEIQQTENELQKNKIAEAEKQKQLQLELTSAYSNLISNIKQWEQKYLFKSPMDGKLQFLNFWTDGQFVQAGEGIFSILPLSQNLIGQVQVPIQGAGKVKFGQEVVLKLDSYPYQEYGTVEGKVQSISLTSNTYMTASGLTNSYLVIVTLPNQLKTNFGRDLKAQSELKGTAEILVNKRRLLQRLFDNLKSNIN